MGVVRRAALERFLLACGERVVRVPPHLMAGRRGARAKPAERSDRRARGRAGALEQGVEMLPAAILEGLAWEIKLLFDHREA